MKKVLVVLAALLSACLGVKKNLIEIPKTQPPPALQFDAAKTPTIAFTKATANLKRGDVVVRFPTFNFMEVDVENCNYRYKEDVALEWDGGMKTLSGWENELGMAFYDTLKERGYRVVGDPATIFRKEEKHQSAQVFVGAVITDIRMNMCENAPWQKRRNTFAGEAYMEVLWSVYDPAAKVELGQIKTFGYAKQKTPKAAGIDSAFNLAFADAAKNLSNSPEFLEALNDRLGKREKPVKPTETGTSEKLKIETPPRFDQDINLNIGKLTRASVVLTRGSGHGSGFIVSEDGYILTAAHVVGEAETITVKFSDGVEVSGMVIRKNAYRDAALVRVWVGGLTVAPIEYAEKPKVGDEVYAIGAPMDVKLASTVSRGIVSAFREPDEKTGALIQSDVMIAGGNSGGPLLDRNGNVVGIAVLGMGNSQFNAGLNFFVPVDDALKYLGVEIAPRIREK